LSQNLLTDKGVRTFLDALNCDVEGLIVEVGAGRGALTGELAKIATRVIAYEIDSEFARAASEALIDFRNVCIEASDFLASTPPVAPFLLAGNLPFSRTNEIIRWALKAEGLTRAVVITQLEFARKRTGDYGRWSLVTVESWPTHDWELLGRIPRYEFRPVPRVDGGVLGLYRRSQPLLSPEDLTLYLELVRLGFVGKGGTLFRSLRARYSHRFLERAFRAARIAPDAVVAYVSPDQWLALVGELGRADRPPG
jgi:23S rRNA (adenine-N6)-dimethyltransferase